MYIIQIYIHIIYDIYYYIYYKLYIYIIHKPNNPGRPIINSNECHTSEISRFVNHHHLPVVKQIPSYIKDTNHFINKVNNFFLTVNSILVTMDVR